MKPFFLIPIIVGALLLSGTGVLAYRVLSTPDGASALAAVRDDLFHGRIQSGLSRLHQLLQERPDDREALYLQGQCLALQGKPETLDVIDKLRRGGSEEYADILDLKLDLLLGDEGAGEHLQRCREKYPKAAEVAAAEWLYRLQRGETAWAQRRLPELMRLPLTFGFQPYENLYLALKPHDYTGARRWALAGKEKNLFRLSAQLEQDEMLHRLPRLRHSIREMELPLAENGPYFGLHLRDTGGREYSVTLDTGTSYPLLTLHDRAKGEALSGDRVETVPGGIQYHYMKKPADMFYKNAFFELPRLRNLHVGYFDGGLQGADGVFSPAVLAGLAITVDPQQKKVWLRDAAAQKRARRRLAPRAVTVPYQVHNGGWLYVTAGVNGKKLRMMLETGSRDVNVNTLAARRYGIPMRDDVTQWQGKDFPIKRPADTTIQLGSISYTPADGLVDDFVMGNTTTGLASSGDLGPAFLKHFRFTIDPFARQLILEPQPQAPVR